MEMQTAVFSPLELNLYRLISREIVAFFWLEQWGGHQNARFVLSQTQGTCVITPRTPVTTR